VAQNSELLGESLPLPVSMPVLPGIVREWGFELTVDET